MDLRMMNYLDERNERSNRERYADDIEDRRRYERGQDDERERHKIGFNGKPPKYDDYPQYENNRMAHKEYDFEDDDFKEPKRSKMYTATGSNNQHMDMGELIKMTEKSFKKELCDVLRYCEMAEAAEADGLDDFAKGLKEMCYEEFTHATFLRGNLKYFGKDPEKSDPDIKKLWHKVSRKFEES